MFAKEAKEAKNVQTIDLSLLLGCRQVHFLTVAIMGIAFCRHNILVARRPFPNFHATNIYCFNFHFYNLNISLLIFILNLVPLHWWCTIHALQAIPLPHTLYTYLLWSFATLNAIVLGPGLCNYGGLKKKSFVKWLVC